MSTASSCRSPMCRKQSPRAMTRPTPTRRRRKRLALRCSLIPSGVCRCRRPHDAGAAWCRSPSMLEVAAKLALIEAVREAGLSKSEFARRIGKDEKEARRLLDPKHPTKLSTLVAALRELGQRLVIGVEPISNEAAE